MSSGGSGETARRKKFSAWNILVIATVVVAVVAAVIYAPEYLVANKTLPLSKLKHLTPNQQAQLVATTRGSVGLVGAAVVAACVTAVGVLVNQRSVDAVLKGQKQAGEQHSKDVELQRARLDHDRTADQASQRAERFKTAAEFLGNKQSAVRLAGVYALISLADEVSELRLTCVEILCAYLRRGDAPTGDDVVRLVIVDEISRHIRNETPAEISWSEFDLDLDGVTLPAISWKDSTVRSLSVQGAYVSESLVLTNVSVVGGIDARSLRIPSDAKVLIATRGEGVINVKDAHVWGTLTIDHTPENLPSPKPRHIILSDSVVVEEGGEFEIVLEPGYSRHQILATGVILKRGLLRIDVSEGLQPDNSPILLTNLKGAHEIGFEIDRRLHDKVTGSALNRKTDTCVEFPATLDDVEACRMVRCRCNARSFTDQAKNNVEESAVE